MDVVTEGHSRGVDTRLPLALLAEASPLIGTGHVVEALSITRAALRLGVAVELWVNEDTPAALRDRSPCPLHVVPSFSAAILAQVAAAIGRRGGQVALADFWRVTEEQVAALRGRGLRVACVDELGNLDLDCDLIVNPSVVEEHHHYRAGGAAPILHLGPQFMPLGEEYAVLHARPRTFAADIAQIVVSMGGVDRSGATLRIVNALSCVRSGVAKHIVIGTGFAHGDELDRLLGCVPTTTFIVHRNLPSLGGLLAACDVGFTAGGNTLYELACVGTPAVVLYEDRHERSQGMAFEQRGFGVCLGAGTDVIASEIRCALDTFDNPRYRAAHAAAGRAIVDGRGAERIVSAVLSCAASP